MSIIPILVVVAVVIFAIYLLLNKNSEERDREGLVRDVLNKNAFAIDFGEGKPVVVKLFGVTPASEGEMLDEKIYAFYDESLRGQRVRVKPRIVGSSEVMTAELYTLSGEYVNAVLVRHGFARWLPKEAPDDSVLAEAQRMAKAEQLGVWNPAIIQLIEDRRNSLASEEMSDDEIANLSVDPEENEEEGRREGS